MGTFTSKAETEVGDGKLKIVEEGAGKKFVKRVDQITFSGAFAREQGQTVYYITERCVFELAEEGLELIEIAPGVNLERDILDQMEFTPLIPDVVPKMDAAIFREEPMGLSLGAPVDLEERLNYDAKNNALYVNFEGLSIETEEDAEKLAGFLDQELSSLGRRVHVVVNYDTTKRTTSSPRLATRRTPFSGTSSRRSSLRRTLNKASTATSTRRVRASE
jgi:propionate CoA-transferase